VLIPLLQTKLYVPPSLRLDGRLHHVHRRLLIEKLNVGVTKKLTLLCAPAGFGKSTLLAEWIADGSLEGQATYRPPSAMSKQVAWLSLDEGDNDPIRFWTYVVAALQTLSAELGSTTYSLLQSPEPLTPDLLLTPLLNEAAAQPAPIVLVLDDYHVINTPAIHQALLFLLDHLPPQLCLILSSRADPPWPLARWRVRGQLSELRIDDLRFTPAEAARFLQESMGLDLSMDAITALEQRTEGWIAGLQLAALSLQGVNDRERFIAAFRGSNRYIVDYLVEEVFSQQPAVVQSFLLQTSILERLCGPLCDAVIDHTPLATRQNAEPVFATTADQEPRTNETAQAILEHLEHANLFLMPLDVERQWYRYHQLFAEVLAHRLRQTQHARVSILHQRASAWYEQQALWPEAIHHALAAEDFARAARLIEAVGISLFAQTSIQHALHRWLATLPAELVGERPRLCLIYAWNSFIRQDLTTAFQRVAAAEAALQQRADQLASGPVALEITGEIAAMHAMLAAYTPSLPPAAAIDWGQQALATLSPAQAAFRCIAALAIGKAYVKQGDARQAEPALAEACRMGQAANNIYLFVSTVANQGIVQRALGSWRSARATCQQALVWLSERNALAFPIVGSLYLHLADLLREQGDLNTAQQYAEASLAHSNQEVNPGLYMTGYLVLMRVKQAQGDWPQVWTLWDAVSALAEQHPMMLPSSLLAAMVAQFQIMESTATPTARPALTEAWTWAQRTLWEEGALSSAYRYFDFIYLYEHLRIARAQVFLAWARTTADRRLLPETLAYLDRQQQIAQAGHLFWFQIKLQLLQALVYQGLGRAAQAQAALIHALQLAQPEGYVRIFVDEGDPLRWLLQEAKLQLADPPLQAYTEQLLAAFPGNLVQRAAPSAGPVLVTPSLIEPLSERELEILRLVHEGLSNSEIAAQIIVTVGTVKKHINNIFGKLGVTSRTQALVQARKYNLL
jgi:LuxR family transcriptional regulator, maltose regulon positive regulatory protein